MVLVLGGGLLSLLAGREGRGKGSRKQYSGDLGVEIDGVCTTVIYSSILLENPSKERRLISLINLCRKSFSFVYSLYIWFGMMVSIPIGPNRRTPPISIHVHTPSRTTKSRKVVSVTKNQTGYCKYIC